MNTAPTIVTVPCLSGTLWRLEQLTSLDTNPLRTMRFPKAPAERREL
jgi:hypothetical protein